MELIEEILIFFRQYKLSIWLIQLIAMGVTSALLPSMRITEMKGAFLTLIGLAFVNTYLWDTALFFKIPDTLSLQVFALLICNGLIFWLLIKILPGIEISGFVSAILAALLFTVISVGLDLSTKYVDWWVFFKQVVEAIWSIRDSFSIRLKG